MPDQKLDNLLNLALDATEEEREKSRNLNVGYEKQTRKWEIIVKYSEMGIANEEEMCIRDSFLSMQMILFLVCEQFLRQPVPRRVSLLLDVYKRQG